MQSVPRLADRYVWMTDALEDDMEIIDLSHNDDLISVIRKCNANFKQLAFSASQGIKAQGRASSSGAEAMVADAINELTNVTIPNEVASQITNADIPGAVNDAIDALDISQMVSDEVAAQAVVPPIGSYLIMQTDPSSMYLGTTWQQSDTIDTTGGMSLPLWERTA